MPNIDLKIKKTFKLFNGTRKEDEDKKIYEKVQTLIFSDILTFLSQHLNRRQISSLKRNLERSKSKGSDETVKALLNSTKKIENFSQVLDHRIDYFLNNLLVSSLRNKQNAN